MSVPAHAARRAPSGWQGPLRAAAAVLLVGFLVVWLVKPIGNPCPDLERLPQGSTASSSPSFAPPGARTCTYTAAGGTQATSKYMPWLDWIVLALLAAVAAGAVRALSPAGRLVPDDRGGRPEPATRADRPRRAEAEPPPRISRPRARRPTTTPRDPSPPDTGERDAAERERARQQRAARNRESRGR